MGEALALPATTSLTDGRMLALAVFAMHPALEGDGLDRHHQTFPFSLIHLGREDGKGRDDAKAAMSHPALSLYWGEESKERPSETNRQPFAWDERGRQIGR